MAIADLHFHSTHSDGKHSVEWLGARLRSLSNKDLKIAVLTDHDGIDGFSEFARETESLWKSICAAELSCTWKFLGKNQEFHLLIYGLDHSEPTLNAWWRKFREERRLRFIKICEKLSLAGFSLDGAALEKKWPGVLGRPHVADALVEAGYVSSRQEGFDRFLKDDSPYSVPKWRFDLEEAVRYAKKHQCRMSLAHPGQYHYSEDQIAAFKELGVDGIEIFHPRNTDADIRFYGDLAKRYELMVTGGSDFHDEATDHSKKKPTLGRSGCPWELAKAFLAPFL